MGAMGYAGADPRAGGGTTPARLLNLNATGQIAKAGPGRLYEWSLDNAGASAAFVKIYNKATAPTASDTPVLTLRVPAGGGKEHASLVGIAFTLGISARAVTGVADNDNTGAGSNEVIAHLFYA